MLPSYQQHVRITSCNAVHGWKITLITTLKLISIQRSTRKQMLSLRVQVRNKGPERQKQRRLSVRLRCCTFNTRSTSMTSLKQPAAREEASSLILEGRWFSILQQPLMRTQHIYWNGSQQPSSFLVLPRLCTIPCIFLLRLLWSLCFHLYCCDHKMFFSTSSSWGLFGWGLHES